MKVKLIELLMDMPYGRGTEEEETAHIESVADYLIENGVTIQRWIPVTERLPSKNQRVLACRSLNGGSFVFLAKKWDNKWFDMEWNCVRYGVTHWMPLPKPPKGE